MTGKDLHTAGPLAVTTVRALLDYVAMALAWRPIE